MKLIFAVSFILFSLNSAGQKIVRDEITKSGHHVIETSEAIFKRFGMVTGMIMYYDSVLLFKYSAVSWPPDKVDPADSLILTLENDSLIILHPQGHYEAQWHYANHHTESHFYYRMPYEAMKAMAEHLIVRVQVTGIIMKDTRYTSDCINQSKLAPQFKKIAQLMLDALEKDSH